MKNSIDIRSIRRAQRESEISVPKTSSKELNGILDILNRDFQFGSTLTDTVKEEFYLELSSLLESGIDVRSSLELISDNQAKKKHAVVFRALLDEIIRGLTFSEALKNSGKFTSYEYFSIQIGEETGKMVIVFKELSIFFKKKLKQRRQIIGAMTYPVIVLFIALCSVSFMLTFVVPMFSDVFRRFGGDLPFATKLVINASAFLKRYLGIFFIILIAVSYLICMNRKKDKFRELSSGILLSTPVVGKLISKIYLARFSTTMTLLISSKIPILQAIHMCRKMISFYPIERSLHEVENKILSGVPLHKALSDFPVYPAKMIAMLKVGEDVNQLDRFFSKLADQYSEEIEHQTSVLSKFIEPVIIVVLGAIVGVILIAMYLPLFKLGQAF